MTILLLAFIIFATGSSFEGTSAVQGAGIQVCDEGQREVDTRSPAKDDPEAAKETTDLLAGDFLKQWQVYNSDPATEASVVWKVIRATPDEEPVLVCLGEPKGFAFTTTQYSDFELTLEWKYPKDANGNSGVLLYTQNEPRIWPTCVQVQLHQPKAGSIFPSGDATTDNTRDADPDLARPVNMWNECRIVSRDGRLSVDINGKKAGEISGAKPASGSIALQSEGSEVHFRRIRLKKIAKEATEPSVPDEASGNAPGKERVPVPGTNSALRTPVSTGLIVPFGRFPASGRKRLHAASACGDHRSKRELFLLESHPSRAGISHANTALCMGSFRQSGP